MMAITREETERLIRELEFNCHDDPPPGIADHLRALQAELDEAYEAIGSLRMISTGEVPPVELKAALDEAFTLPHGEERGRAIVAALRERAGKS